MYEKGTNLSFKLLITLFTVNETKLVYLLICMYIGTVSKIGLKKWNKLIKLVDETLE